MKGDSGRNRGWRRPAVRVLAAAAAVGVVAALFVPQADGQGLVQGITQQFHDASGLWVGRLQRHAQRLFVLLAGFEVVASALILLLKPKRLDDAAGGFVIKILVMSLCFFAITSFELFVPRFVNSFVTAGSTATLVPSLQPAEVVGVGIMLSGRMILAATPLVLVTPIYAAVVCCAVLVALCFAGIACQVVYTLVEGYVAMSAGILFLGFASFRGTAALADNYLMYVLHVGTKLFVLYLLVPLGVKLSYAWGDSLLRVVIGDLSAPLEIVAGSVIFCGLVCHLPQSLASRITSGATLGIAQALRST